MSSVLVTGATGYIGGRLVPELLEAGHRVTCLARNPAKLGDETWHDQIEARKKDLIETVWLYGVSQVKFTED